MGDLFGGIGLLLYGIRMLGNALAQLAGSRAERELAALHNSPVAAFAAGALVTALLQSSSATTVMIACLAHGSVLTPAAAAAAIVGANVGTTLTPYLLVFSPGAAAGWLLALAVLAILILPGNDEISSQPAAAASAALGLALLLYGLNVIESVASPLASDPRVSLALTSLDGRPAQGLLTGFLLATLLDSSSVTIVLLGRVLRLGFLSMSDAMPVLFGINIGTTTATLLSALALGPKGRQVAMIHVLFNIFGAFIFWPFREALPATAAWPSVDPARQLANAHLLFNLASAAVQLPFLRFHLAVARFFFPPRR